MAERGKAEMNSEDAKHEDADVLDEKMRIAFRHPTRERNNKSSSTNSGEGSVVDQQESSVLAEKVKMSKRGNRLSRPSKSKPGGEEMVQQSSTNKNAAHAGKTGAAYGDTSDNQNNVEIDSSEGEQNEGSVVDQQESSVLAEKAKISKRGNRLSRPSKSKPGGEEVVQQSSTNKNAAQAGKAGAAYGGHSDNQNNVEIDYSEGEQNGEDILCPGAVRVPGIGKTPDEGSSMPLSVAEASKSLSFRDGKTSDSSSLRMKSSPDAISGEGEVSDLLVGSGLSSPISATLVDESAERDREEELQRLREELQQRKANTITAVAIPEEELHQYTSGSSRDSKRRVVCIGGGILVLVVGGVVAAVVVTGGSSNSSSSSVDDVYDGPCFRSNEDLKDAIRQYLLDDGPDTELATLRGWPVGNWCVSELDDFSSIFENLVEWNDDITEWNLSSATNLTRMFFGASSFNQNINHWSLSRVESMDGMFQMAIEFDQDLSLWDVSSVKTMAMMFAGASKFNGNLSTWNVSRVVSMSSMFDDADRFDSDISLWDVSNVQDFSNMFRDASDFNQNLTHWDVSNSVDMNGMFSDSRSFNGNVSAWNTARVLVMERMFHRAQSFNADISRWEVSRVTSMSEMFDQAVAFNKDISSWNVSNVMKMEEMFRDASVFNQNISSWDVSRVEYFGQMFRSATEFNQDLSSWNIGEGKKFDSMFEDAVSLNQNLCSWGKIISDKVEDNDLRDMFRGTGCLNTTSPNLAANPMGPFCFNCRSS